MAKIAVVDDDKKLTELLKEYLEENGHTVTCFLDPARFLKENVDQYQIVILDILMPGIDGFEVLRMMRKKSMVPVIMLTARGDVYDRVVGLELGADDYLPKPFEPRELLARIEAVLRRSRPDRKVLNMLEYESFILYPESMKLFIKEKIEDKEIILTTAEFQLLYYFCSNPFRVLSREIIMENTKEIRWESFDRSVDVLVSRLRKKLEDNPGNPSIVKTVWGEGYMFIAKRKKS